MKSYLATLTLLAAASFVQAEDSALAEWWNGKHATGNWFGVRDTLADKGITFGGLWKANFLFLADGGVDPGKGAFQEELKFGVNVDFEKLAGITGLSAEGNVRWRDGEDPNSYVGASSLFNPSTFQGGKQWRLQTVALKWESQDLLWTEDAISFRGGWLNPADAFIYQPESKFFVNNTLTSGRGFTPNNIPWGTAFVGWGGDLKVKTVPWHYVQAGLYMAYPEATSTANHGLAFEGYAQDPSLNGLYFVVETGVTPKFGPSELPGRYAAGFIYWGVENTSFFGANYDQNISFYWQADQMLFREPSKETPVREKGPSDGKTVADGKSFKEPVPLEKPKLNQQGLYAFNLINYAPKYNSALPFYFQSGLIYQGLIPGRDKDQLGVAIAYGNYSYYRILAREQAGQTIQRTYEAVLEGDYRVQLNNFAYIQPFIQYIIRPNGEGLVENATVLGSQFGVTF